MFLSDTWKCFYVVQPWKCTGHCARNLSLRQICGDRNCSLNVAGLKAELVFSLQNILGSISLLLDGFHVYRFFFFFLKRTLNRIKVVVENMSERDYISYGVTRHLALQGQKCGLEGDKVVRRCRILMQFLYYLRKLSHLNNWVQQYSEILWYKKWTFTGTFPLIVNVAATRRALVSFECSWSLSSSWALEP